MKKRLLIVLAVLVVVGLIGVAGVMRDGAVVTPVGEGTVEVDGVIFEAFPLPDYAAAMVTPEYRSYFIEVEPGIKVHVLEAGSGYPLLLQHGNPTSGFLYRRVVEALPLDQVRVIMPTLVGLGFSSKVPASAHTLDNHMRWINGVLTALQVKSLIYAGQDWGGPVGMGALALSPGVLQGAVLMNTGFNAPTEAMDLSPAHARVKTPVVGELLLEVALSIFTQLPNMQGDPRSMPPAVQNLYGQPVEDSGNSKAPLALMRMVTDGPDHPSSVQMRRIEAYVESLNIPAEIVWGMSDPILAQGLGRMQENFPKAPVTRTDAGHFLQEEVPDEIAAALMRVLAQVQAATPQAGTQ